jgi:AraC family transcriptional activator of pobA
VIAIPALYVHGFDFQEDTTGFVLSAFSHEVNDALSTLPKTAPMFQAPMISERERNSGDLVLLQNNIQSFHDEFESRQRGRPSYLRALLKIILIQLSRLSDHNDSQSLAGDKSNTEQYALLSRLIDENFRLHKSVQFYADKLNISSSKLTKLCAVVANQTPHAIVTNRLILEAKRYLTYTSMSLAQITEALGMKDPAYFSRFFKKHCGITPGQFRKNPTSL